MPPQQLISFTITMCSGNIFKFENVTKQLSYGQNQIIKPSGFNFKSARSQPAFNNHHIKITVGQYYFLEQYHFLKNKS